MPPTMRKHGDDTYSSFFKIVYTAQIATVLAGCNCSVDSLLCSSDEGIRYPPDIFSASIFVPFPLSLHFPNQFRVSMIKRPEKVLEDIYTLKYLPQQFLINICSSGQYRLDQSGRSARWQNCENRHITRKHKP